MIKEMNLLDEYFKAVKNRKEIVEVRLYDVKRKNLKVNDIIRFNNRLTNEKIDCKVIKLIKYDNLEELNIPPITNDFVDTLLIGY